MSEFDLSIGTILANYETTFKTHKNNCISVVIALMNNNSLFSSISFNQKGRIIHLCLPILNDLNFDQIMTIMTNLTCKPCNSMSLSMYDDIGYILNSLLEVSPNLKLSGSEFYQMYLYSKHSNITLSTIICRCKSQELTGQILIEMFDETYGYDYIIYNILDICTKNSITINYAQMTITQIDHLCKYLNRIRTLNQIPRFKNINMNQLLIDLYLPTNIRDKLN